MKFGNVLILAATLATAILPLTNVASAQIVALGASNVEGYGVSSSEAWPAQLESILRAKGSPPISPTPAFLVIPPAKFLLACQARSRMERGLLSWASARLTT